MLNLSEFLKKEFGSEFRLEDLSDRRDKKIEIIELNVLALVKGRERYIFFYKDGMEQEITKIFGKYASNPQLSFSRYEATVLSQQVRKTYRMREEKLRREREIKEKKRD